MAEIITNVLVEYTVLYGAQKGERIQTWFHWSDPEIDRLLKDEKAQGKIIAKR